MNYAIQILEEQKQLLFEEQKFSEGKERNENQRKIIEINTSLDKIASAPELLEALQELISVMDKRHSDLFPNVLKAEQAINKALK